MLRIKHLSPLAKTPTRANKDDAGFDLYSIVDDIIPARGRLLIKTGIAIAFDPGWYGRIASRSGLAVKYGLDVGAGVIDLGYRGEIGVLIFNHSDNDYHVEVGAKFAQLVLTRIWIDKEVEIAEVDELPSSERGEDGFGSTGNV